MTDERSVTVEDLCARKLFSDVPKRVLKSLLKSGSIRLVNLKSGKSVELRKKNSEYVYVIVSGYLEVRIDSRLIKKGDSFLVAFRGPEQVVGEMSTIAKEPGEARIRACGPCVLIEIPADDLTRAGKMDWRIYKNLAEILAEKTFQERKRIEVIQMPEGTAQVAQALLIFLKERGAETADTRRRMKIKGVLRHGDVADYICCDRTTVAKRLRSLKKEKIIDYPDTGRNHSQRITICDKAKLQQQAQTRPELAGQH